jgi:hypothetical protein
MLKIVIVFVGLIAHVPIGADRAALLVDHADHVQLLIADPGVLGKADNAPIRNLRKPFRDPAATVVPQTINIRGMRLRVHNEVSGKPTFAPSFDTVPSLKQNSNNDLKVDIKQGKQSNDVAARFSSRSGHYFVDERFAKRGYFGLNDSVATAQCIPKCVKVEISVPDDGTGYVELRSGKKTVIRVKAGSHVRIVNVPRVWGMPSHFESFEKVVYGRLLSPEPSQIDCGETNDGKCIPGIRPEMVDIECSNSRYP